MKFEYVWGWICVGGRRICRGASTGVLSSELHVVQILCYDHSSVGTFPILSWSGWYNWKHYSHPWSYVLIYWCAFCIWSTDLCEGLTTTSPGYIWSIYCWDYVHHVNTKSSVNLFPEVWPLPQTKLELMCRRQLEWWLFWERSSLPSVYLNCSEMFFFQVTSRRMS